MSAPITSPIDTFATPKGDATMAASSIKILPRTRPQLGYVDNLYRGILMAVQKVNSPSVTISPAVLGLLITIVLQFGASMWWASGISKDNEHLKQEVQDVRSEMATMKVYIDNSREKQVKMEAMQSSLEKQQQQTDLLIQVKGAK